MPDEVEDVVLRPPAPEPREDHLGARLAAEVGLLPDVGDAADERRDAPGGGGVPSSARSGTGEDVRGEGAAGAGGEGGAAGAGGRERSVQPARRRGRKRPARSEGRWDIRRLG